MGYKFYTVTNNMYEFTVKGNLASKLTKKCNKLILRSIWVASIVYWFTYLLFNTYWTFIDRNMPTLRIFNFSSRMA